MSRRWESRDFQRFDALGIGAFVMGMVAPMLRGNLEVLAWISLAGGVAGWLAWRTGMALRAA